MNLNLKYILFFCGILFLGACGNKYEIDENFDLEELPGYVAFDAAGNSVSIDTIFVDEAGGTASVTIENPTGSLTDITVNYDISGSAVMGVDYNIVGGSAGTITLGTRTSDVLNPANVDLNVELLTDGVADGDKTITITLTGASNGEGSIAVGRGGKDFLKSATFSIADVD